MKILKGKKYVNDLIQICIICGSEDIKRSKYTVGCDECGQLNFYEVE